VIFPHDAKLLVGCAIQEIWGNMGLQINLVLVSIPWTPISWETSAFESLKIFRVRWFRNFYVFNYFTAIADNTHGCDT